MLYTAKVTTYDDDMRTARVVLIAKDWMDAMQKLCESYAPGMGEVKLREVDDINLCEISEDEYNRINECGGYYEYE